MRKVLTSVNLTIEDLETLRDLQKETNLCRSEMIRRGIELFVVAHTAKQTIKPVNANV